MESVYQLYFDVQLWHDFYLPEDGMPGDPAPAEYDIRDLIEIVPTSECMELMDRCRLLFRKTPLGFQVIAEVIERENDIRQTFRPFADNMKLGFTFFLKDPFLLNYTNLPFDPEAQSVYYLSNLADNPLVLTEDNETRTLLFLSRPLPDYDSIPLGDYQIGDFVKGNNDPAEPDPIVYEVADLPIIMAPKPADEDPNEEEEQEVGEWLQGKNTQYLSKQDSLSLLNRYYTIELPNDATTAGQEKFFQVVDIYGETALLGNQNIAGEEIPVERLVFPEDAAVNARHTLNFQQLSSGRYELHFDGNKLFDFYYSSSGSGEGNPFAALELFFIHPDSGSSVSVSDDYRFIEIVDDPAVPALKISAATNKTYHIHFKNRATFWEYRLANDKEKLVYDPGFPKPLTNRYPEKAFLAPDDNEDIPGKILPFPSVKAIQRKEEQDTTDPNLTKVKMISTIYL